jgi:hypothetical protein
MTAMAHHTYYLRDEIAFRITEPTNYRQTMDGEEGINNMLLRKGA